MCSLFNSFSCKSYFSSTEWAFATTLLNPKFKTSRMEDMRLVAVEGDNLIFLLEVIPADAAVNLRLQDKLSCLRFDSLQVVFTVTNVVLPHHKVNIIT